jgi:excisionase family DNA binding protein
MAAATIETTAEWITLGLAARRLCVSVATVRRLIEEGRLSCRLVPGSWPKVRADQVDVLAAATLDTASPWLTLGLAARRLNVSVTTVRKLVAAGRLSCRRVPGSRPKVPATEVQALAAASTQEAAHGP